MTILFLHPDTRSGGVSGTVTSTKIEIKPNGLARLTSYCLSFHLVYHGPINPPSALCHTTTRISSCLVETINISNQNTFIY